jgi:hypothetical protein
MSAFQFADDMKASNRLLQLIGPSKQGKTTCASTISAFCPDELPAKEKTYLKDTVFIQIDSDGVASLRKQNLVPYVLDLSMKTVYVEFMKAFKEGITSIRERVTAGEIKYVVLDTLTALDKMIVSNAQKTITDNRVWNAILGQHMDVALALKSLPCTIVVCTHTKYIGAFGGQDTPELIAKRKATAMPGRADIGMAMTPSAADYWKTQVSATFPIYSIPEEKGKGFKHVLLTVPKYGFECGHRYANLEEEERPHLRLLLQKAGEY